MLAFELSFSDSMLSKWRDWIDFVMIMELIEKIAHPGKDSNIDGEKSYVERKEEGKDDNKGEN